MKYVIPVLIAALTLGCSKSQHGGDDDAGPGTDSDVDTSSGTEDTDSSSDTGSDTDISPVGWHWEEIPAFINSGYLYDVAGRNADDVVAVGHIDIEGPDTEQNILRSSGASWQLDPYEVDVPGGLGVACTSEDGTYYVTGWADFSIHFMPDVSWTEVEPPAWWQDSFFVPLDGSVNRYLGCLDQSAMTVLFFEWNEDWPFYLSAYNGSEWALLAGPEQFAQLDGYDPYLVWGVAQDDLLLFTWGENGNPSVHYRFDGEQFIPLTTPMLLNGIDPVVGVDGAEEHGHGFYAVGDKYGPVDSMGFVWHSDDAMTWVEVDVPHPPDPETYCEHFHDVWISDEGQVYVVGIRQYEDPEDESTNLDYVVLLHFDGEEWQEVDVPLHPEADYEGEGDLYGVWGVGEEVFAVGTVNTVPAILHYVPE